VNTEILETVFVLWLRREPTREPSYYAVCCSNRDNWQSINQSYSGVTAHSTDQRKRKPQLE